MGSPGKQEPADVINTQLVLISFYHYTPNFYLCISLLTEIED